MYDGYKGVYVYVCWVHGGIFGCMMGIWVKMWLYDGYMGVYVDV